MTVDSNNNVSNAGTITQGTADNLIGIDVQAGRTGTITNSGGINITETFNAPNLDGNAIVDGPIAQANNRTGILVRAGGAHTGNIVNTGTITVDGLNSAGIRVNDTQNGAILTGGAIKVRGDGSVGIHTEAVTGNLVVGGAVQVVGKGAVALDVDGDCRRHRAHRQRGGPAEHVRRRQWLLDDARAQRPQCRRPGRLARRQCRRRHHRRGRTDAQLDRAGQ